MKHHREYRKKCFEKYGEVCTICSATEDVHVHHVDGDRDNNHIDNLRPFCRTCHFRIHTGQDGYETWTEKLGEPPTTPVEERPEIAEPFLNETIHEHVSWMVLADQQILKFLATTVDEEGRPAFQSPLTIGWNTGYSKQHTGNRCRKLVRVGLVNKHERAKYSISEYGLKAVAGKIPPSELEG